MKSNNSYSPKDPLSQNVTNPNEYLAQLEQLLRLNTGSRMLNLYDTGSNTPNQLIESAGIRPETITGAVPISNRAASRSYTYPYYQSPKLDVPEYGIPESGNLYDNTPLPIQEGINIPTVDNEYYQRQPQTPLNKSPYMGENRYYPTQPSLEDPQVADASASLRGSFNPFWNNVSNSLEKTLPKSNYGIGLTELLRGDTVGANTELSNTMANIGGLTGAPELNTNELVAEQNTNPFRQLAGNLTDALGKRFNLPDWGLSEKIAGGKTTNTGKMPSNYNLSPSEKGLSSELSKVRQSYNLSPGERALSSQPPKKIQSGYKPQNQVPDYVAPYTDESGILVNQYMGENPQWYGQDGHAGIDYINTKNKQVQSSIGGYMVPFHQDNGYGNAGVVFGANPSELDQTSPEELEKMRNEVNATMPYAADIRGLSKKFPDKNIMLVAHGDSPLKEGKIATGSALFKEGGSGGWAPHLHQEYATGGELKNIMKKIGKEYTPNPYFYGEEETADPNLSELQGRGGGIASSPKLNTGYNLSPSEKTLGNIGKLNKSYNLSPGEDLLSQPKKINQSYNLSNGEKSLGDTNILDEAGQGLNKLKNIFSKQLSNIFQKKDVADISGGKKAVGEVGEDSANATGTGTVMSMAKSFNPADNRDAFFKGGGAEVYKDYLTGGVNDKYRGALSMGLFNDKFYENPDNIANVFGKTSMAAPATEKYKSYMAKMYPIIAGHDSPTIKKTAKGRYDDGTEWSIDYEDVDPIYYDNQYNKSVLASIPSILTSNFQFTAPRGSAKSSTPNLPKGIFEPVKGDKTVMQSKSGIITPKKQEVGKTQNIFSVQAKGMAPQSTVKVSAPIRYAPQSRPTPSAPQRSSSPSYAPQSTPSPAPQSRPQQQSAPQSRPSAPQSRPQQQSAPQSRPAPAPQSRPSAPQSKPQQQSKPQNNVFQSIVNLFKKFF